MRLDRSWRTFNTGVLLDKFFDICMSISTLLDLRGIVF